MFNDDKFFDDFFNMPQKGMNSGARRIYLGLIELSEAMQKYARLLGQKQKKEKRKKT